MLHSESLLSDGELSAASLLKLGPKTHIQSVLTPRPNLRNMEMAPLYRALHSIRMAGSEQVPYEKTFLTLFASAVLASPGMAQDLGRYTFEGMVGPGFPTGSAKDRLNVGYKFLFGGGVRFNFQWAGLLECQYDHFSLNTHALQSFNQPGGFNRFWSLTIVHVITSVRPVRS